MCKKYQNTSNKRMNYSFFFSFNVNFHVTARIAKNFKSHVIVAIDLINKKMEQMILNISCLQKSHCYTYVMKQPIRLLRRLEFRFKNSPYMTTIFTFFSVRKTELILEHGEL